MVVGGEGFVAASSRGVGLAPTGAGTMVAVAATVVAGAVVGVVARAEALVEGGIEVTSRAERCTSGAEEPDGAASVGAVTSSDEAGVALAVVAGGPATIPVSAIDAAPASAAVRAASLMIGTTDPPWLTSATRGMCPTAASGPSAPSSRGSDTPYISRTTAGSKCVPAQRCSSALASEKLIARL